MIGSLYIKRSVQKAISQVGVRSTWIYDCPIVSSRLSAHARVIGADNKIFNIIRFQYASPVVSSISDDKRDDSGYGNPHSTHDNVHEICEIIENHRKM